MSVLIVQKKELTGNSVVSSIWGPGNRVRERIDVPVTPNRYTLPQIRMEKVIKIKRLLAEGKYDLDEQMNAVLDRLLEVLNV